MPRPSNFTDAQKADLYVLHRAICVYSGEKLWILDAGASPYFTIDWADHIHPVSRGGPSTIDNGVCASWFHNQNKRDTTDTPKFLFFKGKPTKHFFARNKQLPRRLKRDLARFAALHHSDWYFNRAVFRLLLGVNYLCAGKGLRKRDDSYYASAALKSIQKWRRIIAREAVPSLERRKLAPLRPSRDQRLILAIRELKTKSEIRALMKRLQPSYAKQI